MATPQEESRKGSSADPETPVERGYRPGMTRADEGEANKTADVRSGEASLPVTQTKTPFRLTGDAVQTANRGEAPRSPAGGGSDGRKIEGASSAASEGPQVFKG